MTIEEIIDTLNDIETDAIYSLLNSEKQAIEEAIEILEKMSEFKMTREEKKMIECGRSYEK